MLTKNKIRGIRRKKTIDICHKRNRIFKKRLLKYSEPTAPKDYSSTNIYIFAKRKVFVCACSKKTRGRPKVGKGICWKFDQNPKFKSRRKANRFCRKIIFDRNAFEDYQSIIV